MKKDTILKIGIAGGLYNVAYLILVVIYSNIHFPIQSMNNFGNMIMSRAIGEFIPFGFNSLARGIVNGALMGFLMGFIQFAGIAFMFNLVTTKNVVTNTFSKLIKKSEK